MADGNPTTDGGSVDLPARLVDLGRSLDVAAPPDLAEGVLARLAAADAHTPVPTRSILRLLALRRLSLQPLTMRRRVRRWTAVVVVAVVALVGVTPAGRAAVARVARVFGVELRIGTPSAPQRPERLPGETALPTTAATPPPTGPSTATSGGPTVTRSQTRIALDAARTAVDFTVQVPAALGDPDEVLVSDGGRVLSLVYRAGRGRPAPGPGGVSARLDEFDGRSDPAFFKMLPAEAAFIDLGSDTFAVWIGEPHDAVYVDATGTSHTESAHLASNTLIWSVGDVTLRLEGDFTQDQALKVARSVRPLPR